MSTALGLREGDFSNSFAAFLNSKTDTDFIDCNNRDKAGLVKSMKILKRAQQKTCAKFQCSTGKAASSCFW